MRKIWNKGHRIRASNKNLVYHFSIGTLLFVFVAVLLLLNIKQLMRTDWEHFSLLENGLTLSPYCRRICYRQKMSGNRLLRGRPVHPH